MKKRVISFIMAMTMVIGLFGGLVGAEGFTSLKSVSYLENGKIVEGSVEGLGEVSKDPSIFVSFSNGVYRSLGDNKGKIQIIGLEDEKPVESVVEAFAFEGDDIEKTKIMKVSPASDLEEGNYGVLIKKEFIANNKRPLERDILITFSVKENLEEKVEEVKEKVEEKLEEVKEEVGEKAEEVKEDLKGIKLPFKDLKDSKAKDSIKRMYAKGLIKGRSEDVFAPKEKISRAEVVSLMSRVLELENKAEDKFEGLEGKWYKKDALKALEASLIKEEEVLKLEETYSLERVNKMIVSARKHLALEEKSLEDVKAWSKSLLEASEVKVEEKMELTREEFTILLDGLVKELNK